MNKELIINERDNDVSQKKQMRYMTHQWRK